MATTTTEGLSKAQLKRFREQLLAKAEEIRGGMRAGEALNNERTADPDDLAVQSHEEWIFLNRNSIDTMLLREIQESLLRMSNGSYGLCLECEEQISQKRLEAIPWARHCVTCQEELAAQESEDRQQTERRR
jgi:DnaK suppressor protein